MTRQRWREVTKKKPCPACGKSDWCAWTPDGQMLKCERTTEAPSGMVLVKAEDAGGLLKYAEAEAQRRTRAAKTRKPKKPVKIYGTAREAVAELERRHGKRSAMWTFTDATGEPVGLIVRWDTAEGKDIRPVAKNGDGWIVGAMPEPRPLYRLPDLKDAARVYVSEGEKSADTARSLGLTATTSAGGSKAAQKADWRPLAGKEVVLLPDNDEPGREYAEAVTGILAKLTPEPVLKIVELPDLPAAGDIVDYAADRREAGLADGAIRAEVEALADSAKPKPSLAPSPVLTRLSDVQAEPVRWLWPNRMALGKLTLWAGHPDLGKSCLSLDVVARLSAGRPFPDCPDVPNPAAGTILLSAEDDVADTIKPRLTAAGANTGRIVALEAVRTYDLESDAERRATFNLARDLPMLEQAIAGLPDCKLVVIDPLSACLGKTDSHRDADIRGLLAPLTELATRLRVAVLAVTHLRKNSDGPAIHQSMGSLAFVAAARAAYVVARDATDPTGKRKLFLPMKNNLSDLRSGLAYELVRSATGYPMVRWEPEPVEMSADEALAVPTGGRPGPEPQERTEAEEWLRDALADGPRPASELFSEAAADGITKGTLKRAKGQLGVVAKKGGWDGGWAWRLPEHHGREAPTEITCAPSAEPAPLRENRELSGSGAEATCPEGTEEAQVPECRERDGEGVGPEADDDDADCTVTPSPRLDPEQPGPVDRLSGEQRERYKAVYWSRDASMPAEERHRRAWRAAVGRAER